MRSIKRGTCAVKALHSIPHPVLNIGGVRILSSGLKMREQLMAKCWLHKSLCQNRHGWKEIREDEEPDYGCCLFIIPLKERPRTKRSNISTDSKIISAE